MNYNSFNYNLIIKYYYYNNNYISNYNYEYNIIQ